MKATQSEEKSPGAAKGQRADDKDMQKSKSMNSENERAKGGKDMKAEGREGGKDMKAEGKEGGKDMKAQGREDQKTTQGREDQKTTQSREGQKMDQKGAADSKSQTTTQPQTGQTGQTQTGQTGQTQTGQTGQGMQSQTTTGQAGAAARLSTEQRTQITSVIREQRVQPVTNVNFSLSVGTRVPRDVSFHTLPDRVVTIYPEWRGFRFIRVKEQIVIVDPNTYEIVAILDV